MIASLRKKVEERNESSMHRIVSSSSNNAKVWMRDKFSRRSSAYQAPENQSFHVYVTKLKVERPEK